MELQINQRLVSSLVEKMLLHSGYMIYKMDYEKILQKLVNKKEVEDYKPYLKDIQKYKYDFMLIAKKRPYFIKIKFGKNLEFKRINQDLNQGEIILVTPEEPVFQIANTKQFLEMGKMKPLSKFLKIDEDLLKKYKQIIKKKFKQFS